MKVRNGYVWSKRDNRWRKLPRHVWHKILQERAVKLRQQEELKKQ